ncbi:TIGR03435 family protein [Acidicapsa ligni]|uniref:TIGR03435 family protein n=1 Tax=Acidicapsa ligni TaxID=542300 RepID=UPI0021DFE249|nr:TIGR03435 family protein [Acidicapsa ligni]
MTQSLPHKMRFNPILSLLAVAIAFLAAPAIHAQDAPTPKPPEASQTPLPTFDVSTIKPNKPDATGMIRFMSTPSGISYTGVNVHLLLYQAFDVEDDRIFGEPDWVKTTRYDVEAKVDGADAPRLKTLTRKQRGEMLLPLLADRFNLKFHHETKTLPVYELVISKGGSKLKESTPKLDADGKPTGGRWMTSDKKMEATGVKLDALLSLLSQQLGHTVVDKTNLTGSYDFTLKWTPDDAPVEAKGADGTSPTEEIAPSLFTALQEQLGLKLEPRKTTVDVIVIDHIEQPSAN